MAAASSTAPAMATASEKVLSTFELIEAIALRLPLRDLLLSQRINKAFFDVISTSPGIGRALFRQPNNDKGKAENNGDGSVVHIVNPFLEVRRELGTWTVPSLAKEILSHQEFVFWTQNSRMAGFTCSQLGDGEPRPRNSQFRMLVAAPPPDEVCIEGLTEPHPSKYVYCRGADMTYDEIVNYGFYRCKLKMSKRAQSKKRIPMAFVFQGSNDWALLKRSIDIITGADMLKILDNGGTLSSDEIRPCGVSRETSSGGIFMHYKFEDLDDDEDDSET